MITHALLLDNCLPIFVRHGPKRWQLFLCIPTEFLVLSLRILVFKAATFEQIKGIRHSTQATFFLYNVTGTQIHYHILALYRSLWNLEKVTERKTSRVVLSQLGHAKTTAFMPTFAAYHWTSMRQMHRSVFAFWFSSRPCPMTATMPIVVNCFLSKYLK